MASRSIFLSSTARDLAAYREAAFRTIQRLGYHCVRMEDFGAHDWAATDVCRSKVTECDLFLGIIGHVHGSSPEGSDQSYTELEHEAAVAANKPRLLFVAPEDFPLPANLIEPDALRQKQRAFRERVSLSRVRDTFTTPDDLAWRVMQALRNWEQEQGGTRRTSPAPMDGLLPLPPQPYFAHPYPLQEHFTGRASERRLLSEWLTQSSQPVLGLQAMGGMGKSALAWAWLQRDVLGLPLPGVDSDPADAAEASRIPNAGRPEGVLWWSFYERGGDFAAFLNEAITYASAARIDAQALPSATEKVKSLLALLQQRRLLLVLDGFERELRAYASLSAAHPGLAPVEDSRGNFRACVNPHAADLLRRLAGPLQSRVLLTTRHFPRELDGLMGCRRMELNALSAEDAVAFFRAQGIRGTRAEIHAACVPYGYHPLALRLLVALIAHDPARPRDVSVSAEHSPVPDLVPREHHILALAHDALRPPLQNLLGRVAAFRAPAAFAAVKHVAPFPGERDLKSALRELVERGLLFFDPEGGRYDLHPVVRQYAYERLPREERDAVHTSLVDYFRQPAESPSAVRGKAVVCDLCHTADVRREPPAVNLKCTYTSFYREPPAAVSACPHDAAMRFSAAAGPTGSSRAEDAQGPLLFAGLGESPVDQGSMIECYHHMVRAGWHDQAFTWFRDGLADLLYYRLGAYQTYIELLRALFPDGEDQPPRLTARRHQSWVANALATSYSHTGQPRLATQLFRVCTAIDEGQGDRYNHAIGLGNLAVNHLRLGELATAEQCLRQSLVLGKEVEAEFDLAVLHAERGSLLAYLGDFRASVDELDLSASYWARRSAGEMPLKIDIQTDRCTRCDALSHAIATAHRNEIPSQAGGERPAGLRPTGAHQFESVLAGFRALLGLLQGDAAGAREAAALSHGIATAHRNEIDIIRAAWLRGWAEAALAASGTAPAHMLTDAEAHLAEALTRCRRIDLMELEPNILLAWARCCLVRGTHSAAREHASEALVIADRCEYRLKQAELHNFLARLALEEGALDRAREHAATARERAWCDGPPHCYKPALEEADALLARLAEMAS
jgi:tetratricopeptide (TPR) repeat protein